MIILQILLTIVVVLYLLGMIVRLAFRLWIRKIRKDFERQAGGGTGGFSRTYTWGGGPSRKENKPREGEIRVNPGNANKGRVSREIGEYVDFEEVK